MKIDFLLTGMLSILVKYRPLTNGNQQQMEFMMGFLTAVIKELFPEFYSAS